MKRIVSLAACLVACMGFAAPAVAQGNIKIIYKPSAKYAQIRQRLMDHKVLETLQRFLSPLKFPLTIETRQCGAPYAPYVRGGPVSICYEYVALIESLQPGAPGMKEPKVDKKYQWMLDSVGHIGPVLVTRAMATEGPFVQYTLHQVALAVFSHLKVPIWGRRADAADYLATYMMLQFGTDVAVKTIYGTAYFLNQLDRAVGEGLMSNMDYVGQVSGTIRQSYYNMLCIAIGDNPVVFSPFIPFGGQAWNPIQLPLGRIYHCRGGIAGGRTYHTDYSKVDFAFKTLILPHLDKDKLKEVAKMKWLPD